MSNILDPLQLLINEAAELPQTDALKPYTERINYTNPKAPSMLLLDVSGSMAEHVSGKRKIQVLREALDRPLAPSEIAIAFSTTSQQIHSFQVIPEPSGGTALHLAIIEATFYQPSHTLIVSDGKPDCEKQALDAATRLQGVISTLFIGSDDDTEAIAFMSKLARVGCGRSTVCDIRYPANWDVLTSTIAGMLPSAQ